MATKARTAVITLLSASQRGETLHGVRQDEAQAMKSVWERLWERNSSTMQVRSSGSRARVVAGNGGERRGTCLAVNRKCMQYRMTRTVGGLPVELGIDRVPYHL